MATDSAQCEGAFVPNDFTKIAKVGFNDFLKVDEATKMIKKGFLHFSLQVLSNKK